MNEKKLYKIPSQKKVDGVCAGLGEYFNIDPLLFRIAFVLLFLFGGTGALIYIIMVIAIPKKPENLDAK